MTNIIVGSNLTPVCQDLFAYFGQSLNFEDPTLWVIPSLTDRIKRAFGLCAPDFFAVSKNTEWSVCSEIEQMKEKPLAAYSIADVSFFRERSKRYHKQATAIDQKTLEIFDQGLKYLESYKFPFRLGYEIEKKADELKGDWQGDNWSLVNTICHREIYNLVSSVEAHLLRKNANRIQSGAYGSTYFNWVKDKNQLLPEVMEEFEKRSLQVEDVLKLLEPIKWIHGTNSGIFATLPGTDQRLENTGTMLKIGIVPPNSGELDAGAGLNGSNRIGLSGVSIQFFSIAWKYANSYQSQVDQLAQHLANKLELQYLTIKNFDLLMVPLLRLRQWDDDQYKNVFQAKAINHIESMRAQLLSGLNDVIKALDYEGSFDNENLKAVFGISQDHLILGYGAYIFNEPETEQLWTSAALSNEYKPLVIGLLRAAKNGIDISEVKPRLRKFVGGYIDLINHRIDEMLKQATSEQPALKILGARERDWVKNPFPVILASTNIRGTFLAGASTNDYLYSGSPRLGKEIDIIFTLEEHLADVRTYLEMYGLQDQVKVYPAPLTLPIPLIGRSEDRDIHGEYCQNLV